MDSENKAPNSRKPSQCPSDQCVISVDNDIEMVQIDGTTSNYDTELADKVPPLPENKDRHLFVSYSSEDFDDVMPIVNQLEQRFHVTCIISRRDFQPGKEIIANIKESINRSMKNVLMLTPNFVQSGFCKFERDVAFMTSIETGINNVIPVMLHECDVPTSLSTVTYIDTMLPGIDVPVKIIEALIQSELADGTLSLEDHILSKKYENGYCVPFKSRPVKRCLGMLPSVYTFRLKPEDISSLRRAKTKLPEEQLELMFQRLNRTGLVVRYNLTRSRSKMCLFFSCFFLIFSSFCVAAVIVGLYITGKTEPLIYEIYPAIAIPIAIVVCHIVSRDTSAFCNSRKTYLAGLIRSSGRPKKDETPEEKAEAMIKRSISHLIHHVTPSLEELPDAPYNRHNVRKSKMCLCQMIEAGLPLVNGPDPIV